MKKGFTLIELLIVIAIIGTLAVILLVAINPVEQLAKTRDTGRISSVTQLGRAQDAYAVNNGSIYTPVGAAWITALKTSGEVSTDTMTAGTYADGTTTPCSGGAQGGFCYKATDATGTGPILVYSKLEAKTNLSKCSGAEKPFMVYSSYDGRSGVVCTAGEPVVNAAGQTFK